jgi:GNAT superfamily N-acetyltransferase
VGGQEVIFPNWLFQALGLTAQDLRIEAERIGIPERGAWLTLQRLQDGVALVGSCVYRHPPNDPLPLGVLLTTPRLWLGNEELVEFVALETHLRERPGRAGDRIERQGRVAFGAGDEPARRAVAEALTRRELDLMDLHRAARLLESSDEAGALDAVALLGRVTGDEEGPLSESAREVLRRAAAAPFLEVRRRAFAVLAPVEREGRALTTLERFLRAPGVLLDAATREALCERTLSDTRLEAFVAATRDACAGAEGGRARDRRSTSLLKFLAAYGASHPVRYRPIRAFLVRTMLFGGRESVRQEAWRALDDLVRGFRGWLGPAARIAVDPETGQEYRWDQVVAFDDAVPPADRERLLASIKETALLREAVFLFSGGALPRLADIPPGGVWIRALDARHGKAVYRVTVQTRFQGSYDLAINVNHSRTEEQVREEIRYLVLCGEAGDRPPLVEDFGGYWPGHDLWSEEFIPGEPLDRALRRQARAGEPERLRYLWPFLAWSTLAAHVDFWNRTGRSHEIADPAMTSVIVSPHDYHTGARIVSVASVRPHAGLAPMFRFFREGLVEPVEREHPELAGTLGWGALFAPLLEIVGEQEGLRMLREVLHGENGDGLGADARAALVSFVSGIEVRGYVPMRLYFAIRRYARWASLSSDATPLARARTLQEFWDTYGLATVAQAYPETRARFFLETVFREAPEPLVAGLEEIVGRLRRREIVGDGLVEAIADLRARLTVSPDDDAFLARLSFPHLRPEDAAGFVQSASAGRPQSEMVVRLEDQDGDAFHVRHALTPKEVARLHRLFLTAKLDVRFRPEHQYLVAVHERGVLIGGIYYELEDEGRQAHLEKIVVAERYRRKGVADGLMNEFFHRMRAAGAVAVTTGFFRPEYFYAYGFKIEKRYAGLVKEL